MNDSHDPEDLRDECNRLENDILTQRTCIEDVQWRCHYILEAGVIHPDGHIKVHKDAIKGLVDRCQEGLDAV